MKRFFYVLLILVIVYAVQHAWVNLFILFKGFLLNFSRDAHNLFFMVIVAPIWEETLFRHIPFAIGRKYFSKCIPEIIIGSSIIFGWVHGDVSNIVVQGFLGLTMWFVYLKLGLRYAMISHAFWNLICFLNIR